MKFDYEGELILVSGEGLFVFPHGGTVGHEGNLYIADARRNDKIPHQVTKFSSEGEVLMTLGQKGVGEERPNLIYPPNDVVIDPDDVDIFVVNNHRRGLNNRIAHKPAGWEFIKECGSKRSQNRQLSEPLTVAMDSKGRLFDGDRENNRIQIFPRKGNLLMSGANLVYRVAFLLLLVIAFMLQIRSQVQTLGQGTLWVL